MVLRTIVVAVFGLALAGAQTLADELAGALISKSPEGAAVYFIAPTDGAALPSTFVVKFGLRGMGVAPAGVDVAGTGHHHLLVNAQPLDMTRPLPTTDAVRHFGKGQTETEISLPPGTHTLRLVLANHLHIPHEPPVVSEPITVTVVGAP